MTVEAASHISELDPGTIGDATDPVEGGQQVSLVKQVLLTDFANISAAVSADAADLNRTDVTAEGTAAAGEVLTATTGGAIDGTALNWSNLGTVTTAAFTGGTFTDVTLAGTTLNGIATEAYADTAEADAIATANGYTDAAVASLASTSYVDTAESDAVTTANAYTDGKAFYTVVAVIADVSTAETVWASCPVAGTVTRIDTILEGAITVSDATVSLKTAADAAMASVVITQAGSAAGDADNSTSITNATVAAGAALKIETDGLSTDAQRVWVTVTVQI